MIIELGHFAFVMAMAMAMIQTISGLWHIRDTPSRNTGIRLTHTASRLTFSLVALSFFALLHAFVTSDFSVALVTEHSHTLKPTLYKWTALWGNHEGSMLLWVLILTGYGAAYSLYNNMEKNDLSRLTLGIQGAISAIFIIFVLLTSNPFARLAPAPIEGLSLNPLLQDPGLAFHPPTLYIGYVGFSLVFSLTIAALMMRRFDHRWATMTRPWVLIAWMGLTGGLALGSWWAYYELGWGGWWFWDPVENAALIPWLTATALFHSIIVVQKRRHMHAWTALLSIMTFGLCLVGTFLVRSGILSSVHSFTSDPTRGLFILCICIGIIGGGLVIFALKNPEKNNSHFDLISRDTLLIFNNLILIISALVVLTGTLYPVLLDALTSDQISVGAPYYAITFLPLMVFLLILMGIAPLLNWNKTNLATIHAPLITVFNITAIITITMYMALKDGPVLSVIGVAAGIWIMGTSTAYIIRELKRKRDYSLHAVRFFIIPIPPLSVLAVFLAHMGVGVTVLGMTGSTAWVDERVVLMAPGDTIDFHGYIITFDNFTEGVRDNYNTDTVTLILSKNNRIIDRLRPEKRWYPISEQDTSEAAIRTTWTHDIYAVMTRPVVQKNEPDDQNKDAWIIKVMYNPLVIYLWGGVIMMIVGGFLGLMSALRTKTFKK